MNKHADLIVHGSKYSVLFSFGACHDMIDQKGGSGETPWPSPIMNICTFAARSCLLWFAFSLYVRHTNNRGLYSAQTAVRIAHNTVVLGGSWLEIPIEE